MNPLVLSDVHLKSSFMRTNENYSLPTIENVSLLALRRLIFLILFLSGFPVCRLLRSFPLRRLIHLRIGRSRGRRRAHRGGLPTVRAIGAIIARWWSVIRRWI